MNHLLTILRIAKEAQTYFKIMKTTLSGLNEGFQMK